jgi:late competence protein required for DNA uptake (superfamily II DNA/RNA helicase)
MDRFTRTADIVKAYYAFKQTGDDANFVKEVCNFFDIVKDEDLSEYDLNFLVFLANEAGIPQYYDLLKEKFTDIGISDENINSLTLSALFHDASLIFGDSKLHRYQKEVLDSFKHGQRNRYVLTAPTSFGKTFLVYETIQRMQYKNILLIFPSISLLSENYARLCEWNAFNEYAIYSLSEEEYDSTDKNIFIFTPERFLSFMDSHQRPHFDFAFIDEIYKIDNSFVIDQETTGENERDIAYRLSLEFICNLADDMLLAGPYMKLPQSDEQDKISFNNFARDNGFSFLHYNQFEIVLKNYITIKGKKQYTIDRKIIEIGSMSKAKKVANIVREISSPSDNTIIYCGRKCDTESYAKQLLRNQSLITSFQEKCAGEGENVYKIFLNHLQNTFGDDWIVLKALKGRIGIHHSLVPKYIQKEIINLFNSGALICLFSTTTITEGVNTSAKNIIITSSKKGSKSLRQFDAKNIAGRAGRFYHHYSGRVIDLNNGFESIVNGQPEVLEHKNYDIKSPKTDIDYQVTQERYLSENDRKKKAAIYSQVAASEIPPEVFNCFRVIGPKDKLDLYSRISRIPLETIGKIKQLAIILAGNNAHGLHWDGFQQILELISPIVREDKLKQLIAMRIGRKRYSLVTVLLNSYLEGGFLSMVQYYVKRPNSPKTKDEAIRTVADYVYNVFKYHLVKYLGLFDVLYRYHVSKLKNIDMEKVAGLGLLLQKLEYNALSSVARKVSDFGVPFKLIDYYDSQQFDKGKFDDYERYVDDQIRKLLQ